MFSLDNFLVKKYYNDFHCSVKELFFFVSYILYISVMICKESFLEHVIFLDNDAFFKCILLFCLLLLFLKELYGATFDCKNIIYLTIIFCLSVLIKNVAHFATAISLFYFFSSRNVSFKRIAKVTLWITIIWLSLIVGLSLVGIIENYHYQMESIRPREFIGFRYALYAPAFLFNVVALCVFVYREKVHFSVILIEIIVNYWMYEKTDSRMSYYFTLIMIFLTIMLKVKKPIKMFASEKRIYVNGIMGKVVKYGFVFSFALCAVISIVVSIKYSPSNSFLRKLNSKLLQRLAYSKMSYEEYGVSLFGKNINWIGNGLRADGKASTKSILYVDNVYLQFLQHYGIVFFCLVMAVLIYGEYRLLKEKEYLLLFINLIIAFHAVLDDLVMHIWYNTFWFAIVPLVFSGVKSLYALFEYKKKYYYL